MSRKSVETFNRNVNQTSSLAPINLAAERSVLGALIQGDSLLADIVASGIKPEHFGLSEHRRIFNAILALNLRKVPIDYVLVAEELGNRQEDFVLIAGLIDGVVGETNHVLYHASIVRRKWQLRRFQRIGEWMTGVVSESSDPDALIEDAIGRLELIATQEVKA